MTLKEEYKQLKTAINFLESNKIASYKIGEQVVTRLDLPALYQREKELFNRIMNFGGDFDVAEYTPINRAGIRFL